MAQIVEASGMRAVAITPSDSANLSLPSGINRTKGLYVGVTGDVKVDMADGSTFTFVSLSGGMIHPISAKKVYATGTTATSLGAIY